MSGTEDMRQSSDGLGDYVLGEGTATERARIRREIAADVDLAVECAELQTMFDRLSELRVEPTGEVELAVRYAVERRLRLRRATSSSGRLIQLAQIVSIAAASLFAFVIIDRLARSRVDVDPFESGVVTAAIGDGRLPPQVDVELMRLLDASHIPVRDPRFVACVERFQSIELPETFSGWLSAADEISSWREHSTLRFRPEMRREALHATGSPILDHRLTRLAATVASRIDADLENGTASTSELAIGLRAMLAVGSSRQIGLHQDTVHAVAVELLERLPRLTEGAVASSIAALSELAVVEGGRLAEVVGLYTEALARTTLTERPDGRPGLLHWRTPVAELADAGRLLRIAPAFGVHAGLAFRARMMIAAHLDERLRVQSEVEHPALVAAQLYGFGDLIDRESAERALRLWRPELIAPNYVALHHIAWSKMPARPGWAEFQSDLRALSSWSTPREARDAAALLLCLTMNFAAPGALAVFDLRSA
jgi:hypothetical protein